jgi:hypothetical protein
VRISHVADGFTVPLQFQSRVDGSFPDSETLVAVLASMVIPQEGYTCPPGVTVFAGGQAGATFVASR